eukprot:g1029.t1
MLRTFANKILVPSKLRFLSSLSLEVINNVDRVLEPHQISSRPADLETHGRDESFHPSTPPQLLVYPESTQQVCEVLKICHASGTPVVPFGVGTSLEGHIAALKGGICMDLTRMNRILEINDRDFNCRVQTGVTRKSLNEALRTSGLFFSVDPGADATVGGMMATRASGTNTVKFGTMRENVLGCQAVLSNGDIIQTGSKAIKSSAGYDLTHLLCGSEGTLAIITELILKLHPHPEKIAAAICGFPSMKSAVDSAACVIQSAIPVARVELLDAYSISAVNAYSKLSLNECPTLFFEFHGTDANVKEQAEQVEGIVQEFDGTEFQWAVNTEDRNRLWKARHEAYWAILHSRPRSKGFLTDVCVPISKLTDCLIHAEQQANEAGLLAPVVGHVGDGNFHAIILVDPDNSSEVSKAKAMSNSIVKNALNCGGTCTGEHGVGYGKLDYLEQEHGREALVVMHAIKQAFDPKNILNPGKLGSSINGESII